MQLKTARLLKHALPKAEKKFLTVSTKISKLAKRLSMLILKKRRKSSLASISFQTRPCLIFFQTVTIQLRLMNLLEIVSMDLSALNS